MRTFLFGIFDGRTSRGIRVLSGLGFFKLGERRRHEIEGLAFFDLIRAEWFFFILTAVRERSRME